MSQKLDIAIHEVGHILAAHGYGCSVETVSITETSGYTKFTAPKSLKTGDLVGIGMAGWAAEEAIYYSTQYSPLLKIFETVAGLAGVSLFTTMFGQNSRAHQRRLQKMVERARKDIIDMGSLLQIEKVEWLPKVVFEIARPRYFDIFKELDASMYLLTHRELSRYYDSVEFKVRNLLLKNKEAVSRQFFSTKKDLKIVMHLAAVIYKKKHLASPELACIISQIRGDSPGERK